jgi:hypothetical protein
MKIDPFPVGAGRAMATLIAVTAVLALAGCRSTSSATPVSGSSPTASPPGTSAAPRPVSPLDVARTQALTTYVDMWQDFSAAASTSDWQSPGLSQHARGLALSTMSRGLYADHYNGLVTRGEPILHPTVSSIQPADNPTTAMITDCGDSTHALKYRADNGQPADDGPGGHRLINATVQKQPDGEWKVSDFGIEAVGSC